jgi:hypothetical protein
VPNLQRPAPSERLRDRYYAAGSLHPPAEDNAAVMERLQPGATAEAVLPAVDQSAEPPVALARAVRHPTAWFGAAGFAASVLIVVAGGRVGTVQVNIPLTTWFGLLSRSGYRPGESLVPGMLLMAGIAGLVLLWLALVRGPHRAVRTEGRVWLVAGAWVLPLIVGPPLLSNDVYSYAAQGLLVDRGLDPYSVGPAALGNIPAVGAVDPAWRSVPSPYGPLATWFQHFAVVVAGGNPLGALIVFRFVAAACVVGIGLLAVALAGPRRIPALTLTVLNPLVLLQVISAAHLEGLLGMLLLGALLAQRRGNHVLGIVLGCAAAAIKVPALIVVLAGIVARQRGARPAWLAVARDAGLAIATCLGLAMLVPHGWGWASTLNTPALNYTSGAPASLLADVLHLFVRWASFDDVAMAGRAAALLAAACIVIYLTATTRHRPLEVTVGFGLLAVALLSPVIYPWYLLWGVLCLAPTARGRLRELLVVMCASASAMAVPGLPGYVADLIAVGLAVCAVVMLVGARAPLERRVPLLAGVTDSVSGYASVGRGRR